MGINVIGMRPAGLSTEQINAVRVAFRILFRDGLSLPAALAKVDRELGAVDVVAELITFLRASPRGINPMRSRGRGAEAA